MCECDAGIPGLTVYWPDKTVHKNVIHFAMDLYLPHELLL